MRDGRLVTRRSDLWMARASLCLARGQQRGTPGARNRSQINVARQVSSRFFSPRRRSRIRTIYRAVRFDHFSLSLFPRSWKQKCQRILFHGFRFLSFPSFLYFLFPRDRDIRRIIPASRNHRSRDSIFSFFFFFFSNIPWNSSRSEDPSRTHFFLFFSFRERTCPAVAVLTLSTCQPGPMYRYDLHKDPEFIAQRNDAVTTS